MIGYSERQYAAHLGESRANVRKLRDAGYLVLHPDGSIDVGASDAALSRRRTRGRDVPKSLAAARKRKLAAEVAVLQDQVAELEVVTTTPAGAETTWREFASAAVRRLLRIAPDAAKIASGRPPAEAEDVIRDVLYAALTEISGVDPDDPASDERGEPLGDVIAREARETIEGDGPALADLDESTLAKMKVDLQARRIELRRALARGELLHLEACGTAWEDRILTMRAQLLVMPNKVAPEAEGHPSATFAAVVRREIEQAVAELAWRGVTPADLLPRRKKRAAA